MAAKNINVRELRDLIESKKPVLVDFWATWCPHCRKINPAYEQIAEEYAGRLEVVKVDVDQDETLWEELELIPDPSALYGGKARRFHRRAAVQGRNRGIPGGRYAQRKEGNRKAPVRHDHHRRRPRRIYRGAVRSQSGP